MSAPKSSDLARSVLQKNLRVKKGESVVIEAWPHSLELATSFVAEARRLGARPTLLFEDESTWWSAVSQKQYAPFEHLSEAEKAMVRAANVYIYFWGPEDTPKRDELPEKVQERLTGWNEEWYAAARKGGVRGCRMTVATATDPVAKKFGFEGAAWRNRLLEAGTADASSMLARGRRLAKKLENGTTLHVAHPNGTDLTIQLKGVHSRVDTGIVDAAAMKRPYGMLSNNPSGQVMVAIDRSQASGTLVGNRAVYLGPNRFDGVRWKFENGRLVEHSGGDGNEMFEKQFGKAPKGKDQLGYLSIGLNPASRDLPPVEDTEEGAILIGVGSNAMVGGKIRIPFQGYALLGEGTIEIDDSPVAKGGRVL